jgi:hypothetical protein
MEINLYIPLTKGDCAKAPVSHIAFLRVLDQFSRWLSFLSSLPSVKTDGNRKNWAKARETLVAHAALYLPPDRAGNEGGCAKASISHTAARRALARFSRLPSLPSVKTDGNRKNWAEAREALVSHAALYLPPDRAGNEGGCAKIHISHIAFLWALARFFRLPLLPSVKTDGNWESWAEARETLVSHAALYLPPDGAGNEGGCAKASISHTASPRALARFFRLPSVLTDGQKDGQKGQKHRQKERQKTNTGKFLQICHT